MLENDTELDELTEYSITPDTTHLRGEPNHEYKDKRFSAILIALFIWLPLAWEVVPIVVEPFIGASEYHADVIVSGRVTDWKMVEAKATLNMSHRAGETRYWLVSFGAGALDDFEDYSGDWVDLKPGAEAEVIDADGNFWYVFLPPSSAKSPFTGILWFSVFTVAVVGATVGYVLHAKKKYWRP